MAEFSKQCWICGGSGALVRRGLPQAALATKHFNVTDKAYGATLDLYRCATCGFEFCPTAGDPTAHYAALADVDYINTNAQRVLQARHIVRRLLATHPVRTLLDVGAGAGNLVKAAEMEGIKAVGVEPCRAFAEAAAGQGLRVVCGVLPHPEIAPPFEAVTLVDVLEHVSDPKSLLAECLRHVAPGGALLFITPDRDSLAARILGARWWHRRVAHIGYFSRADIERLLRSLGITDYAFSRPTWVFSVSYLLECIGSYLPGKPRLRLPWMETCLVRLNFYDSWCVLAKKPI